MNKVSFCLIIVLSLFACKQRKEAKIPENLAVEYNVPDILKSDFNNEEYNNLLYYFFEEMIKRGASNLNYISNTIYFNTENSIYERRWNMVDEFKKLKQIQLQSRNDELTKLAIFLNSEFFKDTINLTINFESIKPHLFYYLSTDSSFSNSNFEFVTDSDINVLPKIPGLKRAIIVRYPKLFVYINHDDFLKINKSKEVLFNEALYNSSEYKSTTNVMRTDVKGGLLYHIVEPTMAASLASTPSQTYAEFLGELGAIISFPDESNVFLLPINDAPSLKASFLEMKKRTDRLFLENPNPISNTLYYYNQGFFPFGPNNEWPEEFKFIVGQKLNITSKNLE